MAIRLRKVKGYWVALCAVESDAKEEDIYLDDSQDHALRCKFKKDYASEGIEAMESLRDLETEKLMETQKIRDCMICNCPSWDQDPINYLGCAMCVGCGKPIKNLEEE